MALKVCELFMSIQGESTRAGLPCFFVRLTGCNLRCRYCDTRYAYEEGTHVDIKELVKRVGEEPPTLVEITGGEPLLQAETPLLIDTLVHEGYEVLIETNGSIDIGKVNRKAFVIMDLKAPSSGMSDSMDYGNVNQLKPGDEVKIVVGDRKDYEWAMDVLERYEIHKRCTVLLSPIFGVMDPRTLVHWILEDRLPVRLNMQLHKYIFGPEQRGV